MYYLIILVKGLAVYDFLKDLGIIVGGAVTGLAVDIAVGTAWGAAGLPMQIFPAPLQELHLDDLLELFSTGLGAYWMHTKDMKEVRNFLIGMFGEILAFEVYEALVVNGVISPWPSPAVATMPVKTDHVRYVVTS